MEPPVLSVPPPNLMPPPAPDIATCNRPTNNAPSKITIKCGGKTFPIVACTTNTGIANATADSSNTGVLLLQQPPLETTVNKRRKKNKEEPERNHNCKTPPPVAASSPPPPTLPDLNQTREKPNHDLGISVERINHSKEDDQDDELPEPTPLEVTVIAATSPETHRTSISGGNGGGIRDGTGGGGRVWDGRIRNSRNNNKKERAKFSYSLMETEIKEDFLKMLDPKEKPPRRQKKRPKDLQKQFDRLVPGFHLTEIKADLYKVLDDTH
ncbi:hypothetical protein PIB30_101791 [Stylosanthes scabra]|uniref:Uncharacterized protein n=1 Tax=Stylosanthes scabra TaxID=79078 RepID=A0ABU6QXL1_9FABA|nr:hypothetical protein [Stylosanthes scabra]